MSTNVYEPKEYTSFYNLSGEAFNKDVALENLYKNTSFTDIQQRLLTTIKCNYFSLLLGEPGTGKSTSLRFFINNLDRRKYEVIYISESQLTPRWLYTIPLNILGCTPASNRASNKRMLHEQFRTINENGRKVVFIVDEAHHMAKWHTNAYKGNEGLEELRFLLNDNCDYKNPIPLILAGQNELLNIIGHKNSKAVAQRVNLICTCKPFTSIETALYIQNRLEHVGLEKNRKLFQEDALALIATASDGIPRVINTICTAALYFAAHEQLHTINADLVKLVIDNEILPTVLSAEYQA